MSEILIIWGILLIVSIGELFIWKGFEWFEDDYSIGLLVTNIVILTILISLRVLGN